MAEVNIQYLEECACELKDVLRRISEEQAARRRLKREFTNFQEEIVTMLEASPVMYLLLDGDLHICKANRAALQRAGCSEQALKGKHLVSFLGFDPERDEDIPGILRLKAIAHKTLRQNESFTDISIILPCLCRSSRSSCSYIVSTVPYSVDGASYGLIAIHDLTVCNQASEEAAHQDRMRALASLSSTLANEGNNLVQIVLGNLSIARLHLPSDSEVHDLLSDIEGAALRWADLCTTLVTLGTQEAISDKEDLSPALLTAQAATRFRHRHGPQGPTLDVTGCEGLARQILVNKSGLDQALDAILDNASDAAPRGSTVSLAVTVNKVAHNQLPPLAEGEYVTFTVHDNGAGIPLDTLKNIFDPLYTTKPGAYGLGLSVAYSILRRHEGTVTVSSNEGKGTTVTLYVPLLSERAEGKIVPLKPKKETIQPSAAAKGRVLMMDDEPIICAIASEMLDKLGWQVTTVKNGTEAVAAYRAARDRGNPYSLVILDLSVPAGMGGRETIRQLRVMDPNVVAIVSSGMQQDPVVTNYEQFGFNGSLPKPYTFEDLEEVLSKLFAQEDNLLVS